MILFIQISFCTITLVKVLKCLKDWIFWCEFVVARKVFWIFFKIQSNVRLFFHLREGDQRTPVPLEAFPDTTAHEPAGHEFPIINCDLGVKLGSCL